MPLRQGLHQPPLEFGVHQINVSRQLHSCNVSVCNDAYAAHEQGLTRLSNKRICLAAATAPHSLSSLTRPTPCDNSHTLSRTNCARTLDTTPNTSTDTALAHPASASSNRLRRGRLQLCVPRVYHQLLVTVSLYDGGSKHVQAVWCT
jgi:hypothetical protein